MKVFYALAIIASVLCHVFAQHHHDPFAGSNCTCDTFCSSQCSLFPSGPQNVTLYRMTPKGVFGLTNKNTGDIPGDTSFVISRRTQALECRQDPSSFFCKTVTQFNGDDGNNTDLVLQVDVEIDGKWGPYLPCNPVNVSKPHGPWFCSEDLHPPKPSGGGVDCKNFTTYSDYAWHGGGGKTTSADTLDACCATATAAHVTHWDYDAATKTCTTFAYAFGARPQKGVILGYKESGPPACNCTRLYQTVGRENLTAYNGMPSSMHPAGGEWYSHPEGGECGEGHFVGDGSGCTWRLVATKKIIAAKCLYDKIDTHVEQAGGESACFSACGSQAHNRSSTCYLKCYSDAVKHMGADELVAPWLPAFNGGCPEVPQVVKAATVV